MPKREENGKQESKVKEIVEGLHQTQYPNNRCFRKEDKKKWKIVNYII